MLSHGMNFLVFSRRMAEDENVVNHNCQQPYIWISIGNPADLVDLDHHTCPNPVQNEWCRGVCQVLFDDVLDDAYGYVPMSEVQANQIVDFVDDMKDEVTMICVHCEAGISRSSATAMSLSWWLNGNDSGIGSDTRYYPNRHTKNMLRTAMHETGRCGGSDKCILCKYDEE
jgi:predicted protein tyrosine phosphatase